MAKVIYPKYYNNKNESCVFAGFGPIGTSGQYCENTVSKKCEYGVLEITSDTKV